MRYLNLGLVAHVDAGKTTTTEQLLVHAGALREAGSVDRGTASTDWLGVERRRGISVRAAQTRLTLGERIVNLIDTPGHTDFADEVERALSVLDAAVLIVSAAEGVQSQTRVLFDALTALGVPTLFFLNKCDRMGCDPQAVQVQLGELTGAPVLAVNTVEQAGSRAVRTAPLVWADAAVRVRMQERLADCDDAVGEAYITDTLADAAQLQAALARCCAARTAYPLVFGAAGLAVGVAALADAVVRYLPAHSAQPDGPLSGVIYKLEHDPKMGKLAYLRLYSGTLHNRDTVRLSGREQEEKITQIRTPFGAKQQDAGKLVGGDIAVVCGLASAKTGDRLGEALLKHVPLAVPLFSVRVLPDNEAQLPQVVQAVGELADENPLLDFAWLPDERELHIKILGKIQLEVLAELLRERYALAVHFSPPTVLYKETPTRAGVGFEAYTMPKPCWAVIRLELEPLPRGSGLVYRSVVQDRQILRRYQNHIETTVPEALGQGLYGWEVTDLAVTLVGGEHHLIHTHPLDFFLATPMAVMNGLENCGTTVLEPLNTVRLTADEAVLGRVIGDVLAMRGQFDAPVLHDGEFTLEALLPVATSADYPIAFAALTRGKGQISLRFARYDVCPVQPPPSTPRRGVDPRDRSKWILSKRGAL